MDDEEKSRRGNGIAVSYRWLRQAALLVCIIVLGVISPNPFFCIRIKDEAKASFPAQTPGIPIFQGSYAKHSAVYAVADHLLGQEYFGNKGTMQLYSAFYARNNLSHGLALNVDSRFSGTEHLPPHLNRKSRSAALIYKDNFGTYQAPLRIGGAVFNGMNNHLRSVRGVEFSPQMTHLTIGREEQRAGKDCNYGCRDSSQIARIREPTNNSTNQPHPMPLRVWFLIVSPFVGILLGLFAVRPLEKLRI